VISGFHLDINETFALLEYYAALLRSYFPTIWKNLSIPSSVVKLSCLTPGVGTDRPSQNVDNNESALHYIPEEQRFQHVPNYVYIKISINVMQSRNQVDSHEMLDLCWLPHLLYATTGDACVT
jgi:hypothetical protein